MGRKEKKEEEELYRTGKMQFLWQIYHESKSESLSKKSTFR